ncbi:MAG: PTS sugar transporter subunit IIA [Nocardioidaceae bacterium]
MAPVTAVRAAVQESARDWSDAVRSAAQILVQIGSARSTYPQACVEVVQTHGPYIVFTPGLALVHARPEAGGLALGVAVLRLDNPVSFGHQANDPVDVLVAFSSPDQDAHIETLSTLAKALGDGFADRIRAAGSEADLQQAVEGMLRD